MATTQVIPVDTAKKVRQRSPNYPTVGLEEALARVGKLFKEDGRAGAPTEIAAKHIGYATAHGQAYSVLSALKKFGLLEEGKGRVAPSQRAIELLNLPANDPRRLQALKDAALSPPVYRELVEQHAKTGLPGDEALEAELVTYKSFNPNAVPGFVKDFRATLEFAGLSDFAVLGLKPKEEEHDRNDLGVGDYVQWEPNGIQQFQEPRRVTEICEGFAFVEGSPTGMPVDEVRVEQMPVKPVKPVVAAQRPVTRNVGGSVAIRQDVFSVTEGDVVLSWPPALSADSIQEIKDWLKIAERKIARSEKGNAELGNKSEA